MKHYLFRFAAFLCTALTPFASQAQKERVDLNGVTRTCRVIFKTNPSLALTVTENKDVRITTAGSWITFEPTQGGYYLKADSHYISNAGSWNITATTTPQTIYTLTHLENSTYTINSDRGSIGTDDIDEYSMCYSDKSVDRIGDRARWIIHGVSITRSMIEAFQGTIPTTAFVNLQQTFTKTVEDLQAAKIHEDSIHAITPLTEAYENALMLQEPYADFKQVSNAVKALKDQAVYTDANHAKATFDASVVAYLHH